MKTISVTLYTKLQLNLDLIFHTLGTDDKTDQRLTSIITNNILTRRDMMNNGQMQNIHYPGQYSKNSNFASNQPPRMNIPNSPVMQMPYNYGQSNWNNNYQASTFSNVPSYQSISNPARTYYNNVMSPRYDYLSDKHANKIMPEDHIPMAGQNNLYDKQKIVPVPAAVSAGIVKQPPAVKLFISDRGKNFDRRFFGNIPHPRYLPIITSNNLIKNGDDALKNQFFTSQQTSKPDGKISSVTKQRTILHQLPMQQNIINQQKPLPILKSEYKQKPLLVPTKSELKKNVKILTPTHEARPLVGDMADLTTDMTNFDITQLGVQDDGSFLDEEPKNALEQKLTLTNFDSLTSELQGEAIARSLIRPKTKAAKDSKAVPETNLSTHSVLQPIKLPASKIGLVSHPLNKVVAPKVDILHIPNGQVPSKVEIIVQAQKPVKPLPKVNVSNVSFSPQAPSSNQSSPSVHVWQSSLASKLQAMDSADKLLSDKAAVLDFDNMTFTELDSEFDKIRQSLLLDIKRRQDILHSLEKQNSLKKRKNIITSFKDVLKDKTKRQQNFDGPILTPKVLRNVFDVIAPASFNRIPQHWDKDSPIYKFAEKLQRIKGTISAKHIPLVFPEKAVYRTLIAKGVSPMMASILAKAKVPPEVLPQVKNKSVRRFLLGETADKHVDLKGFLHPVTKKVLNIKALETGLNNGNWFQKK